MVHTTITMQQLLNHIFYLLLPEGVTKELEGTTHGHGGSKTRIAANILSKQCSGRVSFELVEGTHFSPVLPRIELTVKKNDAE